MTEKGYVKWDREQSFEAVELLKVWEENTKLASTSQQEAWWEALVR